VPFAAGYLSDLTDDELAAHQALIVKAVVTGGHRTGTPSWLTGLQNVGPYRYRQTVDGGTPASWAIAKGPRREGWD
jgi:hypothetical protein